MLFGNSKATLDYSVNTDGFVGGGSLSFDGQGEDKKIVGKFSRKYHPCELDFMLALKDLGWYNFKFKYAGDEGSTFEFIQQQEIGLETLWTQKLTADGVVMSDFEYRAMSGSYFINIFVVTCGKVFAYAKYQEDKSAISVKVEPIEFKDFDFALHIHLNDPEHNSIVRSYENMYFTDSVGEDDYLSQITGELGFGYSAQVLRGGKLVFSNLLKIHIENSNETCLVTMDTETEYSSDFFAYDLVCDAYAFLPSECFTRENYEMKIFLDKTSKIFGLLTPLQIHQSLKHDGVRTMVMSMNANQSTLVFSLYLPYYEDEEQLIAQTYQEDMKLVVTKKLNNYQAEFKRFGKSHLIMNFRSINNLIQGTMEGNYLQLSDSMITKVLCSGLDCFEQVVFLADYTLDMELVKYSVGLNVTSVSVNDDYIEYPDTLEFEEGSTNGDQTLDNSFLLNEVETNDDETYEEDPSSLDNTSMVNFMRIQGDLDRIQGIGPYALSGTEQTEDVNLNNLLESEPESLQTLPNGNNGRHYLVTKHLTAGGEITMEMKFSFVLDLTARNFLFNTKTEDEPSFSTKISWEKDSYEQNKVTFEAFENMMRDTRSQFTIDWLTVEKKFGILFIRDISIESLEKWLVNAEKDALTILTDPGAPLSAIGQQSVYGMGVLGPDMGHLVVGQMKHWDKTEIK
eukprot:GFUD01120889.1.p1 GENE.GFUD01120889.1~~GFUD01120889.1.p1  ORF type:complete len:780 (-),score=173.60 GFUD01120889.1:8-2047(-)